MSCLLCSFRLNALGRAHRDLDGTSPRSRLSRGEAQPSSQKLGATFRGSRFFAGRDRRRLEGAQSTVRVGAGRIEQAVENEGDTWGADRRSLPLTG